MQIAADDYRSRIGAWVKARLLRDPKALRIDCEALDLFVVRNVMSPAECERLMEIIDQDLTPSQLMSPPPEPDFRTSQSCHLNPHEPEIAALEGRFHEVMGIQPELGETAQGQRYALGQQFKPHWDFFVPGQPYYDAAMSAGGQRTWTAMLFLNEPDAGGQTNFTKAGISIRPRTGNLLVWNNLTPEGEVNERSMHQGTPVTEGKKYIITKWYRERQWRPLPDGVQLY